MKTQKRQIVFLLLLLCFVQGQLAAQSNLESLEQAERDFAAYCSENGIPEAWMKYFSPNGFVFSPVPKNAHEENRPRMPSPKPMPFALHWEPYHGAVAESGDLGFNTGPWRITSNRSDTLPPLYGYFFSVWKKEESGEWKVLLDLGINVATAGPEHVFGAPFTERVRLDTPLKNKAKTLSEAESQFNQAAGKELKNAYSGFAASNLLSCINGFYPFDGREVLLAWFAQKNSPYFKRAVRFSTANAAASENDDFGYSFGSYEVAGSTESGHYIRVWQKSQSGKWQLLAEVLADNVSTRPA